MQHLFTLSINITALVRVFWCKAVVKNDLTTHVSISQSAVYRLYIFC